MAKLPENFKIIEDLEYITKVGDMFCSHADEDWSKMTKNGGLDKRTWKDIKAKHPHLKIAAKVYEVEEKPIHKFPPAPEGFRMLSHAEMLNHTFSVGEYFINDTWMNWEKVAGYDGMKVKNELDKFPIFAVCVPIEGFKPKPIKFPPPPDGFIVLSRTDALKYTFKKGDFFIKDQEKWEEINYWKGHSVRDELGHLKNFAVAVKGKPDEPIKIEEIKDLKYIFVKHFKHYYTNTKDDLYWSELPNNYYGKTVEKFKYDNGKEYRLGRIAPRFAIEGKPYPWGY